MPAYSFKLRFAPMVKDRTKRQTIRTFRKHPVKPGQKAHLYTGMRTKNCQALLDSPQDILDVKCIIITEDHRVILLNINWLSEDDIYRLNDSIYPEGVTPQVLSKAEKDVFAWNDGFRHQDRPLSTDGCFDIMVRWFSMTHSMPFIGNVIYW